MAKLSTLGKSLLWLGLWGPAVVMAQAPTPPAPTSQAPTSPPSAAPTDGGGDGEVAADDGWLDRWLYNARERTQRALDAQGSGRDGSPALETAMQLRDGDPLSRYNAGTGYLQSAQPQALPLLQGAAEDAEGTADPAFTADAHYNLGNAHLGQQDYEAAIESYKSALRQRPDLQDAKFNLELARRLLKEQQQQQDQQQDPDPQNQDQQEQDQQQQDQQQQDQQQQDQQNPDQEPQDPQDQDSQDQDSQDQDSQDQDSQDQDSQDQDQQEQQQDQQQQNPDEQQQEQPQDSPQQDPEQQQQQPPQESPLPQFKDLPDMSAEEAAAMLEAIENMEREQRRQEALEAAKSNAGRKKDW